MNTVSHSSAKINLFLQVTGKRPDGYHELATVFWPVPELYDTITLEVGTTAGLALSCSDPSLPADTRNLAWRAALRFAEAAKVPPAWRLHIDKRIPVAGGLGGGSSNAATVLRLLNDAYGQPLTPAQLHQLAGGLGADVPFFLLNRPALATGIGDQLLPLALPTGLPPPPLLLINPGFPIATAWAYQHWNSCPLPPVPPVARIVQALESGDWELAADATYNSLEHCALRKFPLLALLLEFLVAQGCRAAHVSGSGATVYALCQPGTETAVAAAVRREFAAPLWLFAPGGLVGA